MGGSGAGGGPNGAREDRPMEVPRSDGSMRKGVLRHGMGFIPEGAMGADVEVDASMTIPDALVRHVITM